MREVDVADLERALAQGSPLVDVRRDDEFVSARVPGARHIPLDQLPARTAEIPTGQTVYVICAHGVRSITGAQILQRAGYDAVSVAGGTADWIASGRNIDRG